MRYWEAKFSLNHIVWEVRMMYDGARTVYARLIIKVKFKKKKKGTKEEIGKETIAKSLVFLLLPWWQHLHH